MAIGDIAEHESCFVISRQFLQIKADPALQGQVEMREESHLVSVAAVDRMIQP